MPAALNYDQLVSMYRRVPVPLVALIATFTLLSTAFLFAQNSSKSAAARPGSTWASIAQLPDFTGVWEVARGGGGGGAAKGAAKGAKGAPQAAKGAAKGGGKGGAKGGPGGAQAILYTPKYDALLKAYQANPPQDTPAANCVPPGMPGIMGQPYPMEFVFSPGKVTILIEAYMQIRHIYTDGRPHPEDPDLTFNGHSIGHWEGDTLVVDSVGFTTDTPLSGGGTQHSDKMHIVERIRLTNPDLMEITTTIDDPEALQQPFTRVANFARHRDWTLAEYICQQNNRNFVDANGKAGIILTQ